MITNGEYARIWKETALINLNMHVGSVGKQVETSVRLGDSAADIRNWYLPNRTVEVNMFVLIIIIHPDREPTQFQR
jgi:hypothetical protein